MTVLTRILLIAVVVYANFAWGDWHAGFITGVVAGDLIAAIIRFYYRGPKITVWTPTYHPPPYSAAELKRMEEEE
jgi:O-antigen/teichoic acid export membrane protein